MPETNEKKNESDELVKILNEIADFAADKANAIARAAIKTA